MCHANSSKPWNKIEQLDSYKSVRKSGFSLVELLIVIMILAVLIALLLPAMQKARASARQATCASNLRQLSLSMTLYAAEYNGALIFGYSTQAGPMQGWVDAFSYARSVPGGTGLIANITTGGYDNTTMPPLLRCPADMGNVEFANRGLTWKPRPQIERVSYGLSGYSCTEDKARYRRIQNMRPRQLVFYDKLSQLISGVSDANQPARRLLMLRTGSSQSSVIGWFQGSDRHPRNSINISFMDGSVESIELSRFLAIPVGKGIWIGR